MYIFEQVSPGDQLKIESIFEILKKCGEYMFENQGLQHWRNPYSIESIKKNCTDHKVFLVKDVDRNVYVNTFQLELIEEVEIIKASITKFATVPNYEGKGIGRLSMDFIENICRENKTTKISLDVYENSQHAIDFYKKQGFSIVGSKRTKHFKVLLMEKMVV